MKFTIDIDLPADVLAKYEPMEVRQARHGDVYLAPNSEVTTWLQHFETGNPVIILRPKATWPEWPVWLDKFACVARQPEGDWLGYMVEPDLDRGGWRYKGGGRWRLSHVAKYTTLTLPTYDGPWEHSLIRNPHLDKAEPVAVDTDGEVKPVAELSSGRLEWMATYSLCELNKWKDYREPIKDVALWPIDNRGFTGLHLREVKSGDPDPDAAKWLIEAAESVMSDWRWTGSTKEAVVARQFIDNLRDALAAAKGGQ